MEIRSALYLNDTQQHGDFFSICPRKSDGTDAVYVALVSLAIAVPSFLLMIVSVRCPHCGLRIVWYGVSKKDHREWFTWLMTVEQCPNCGYVAPGK